MYRILMCCYCPHIYNEISHGFIEAGCKVLDFNIGDEYTKKTELLKQKLAQTIDTMKPDIVFSYGWWKIGINITEIMDMLRRKGVFRIWWSYDDPICFRDSSLPAAKGSDIAFTTAVECIPDYERNGVRAFLMEHGCSPHHTKVPAKSEYEHDIVLLANNYNIRSGDFIGNPFRLKGIKNVLEPLVDGGYDIRVWGRWWTQTDRAYVLPGKNYGGVVPAEEVPSVYSSCKIALGLQQVEKSRTHLSNRTYEVLGCGAFHICQYSPALEHYFKKGVHLEWSTSREETLELVKYYLPRENERLAVALNGQQEVLSRHLLIHRARAALEIIKRYVKPKS